jgi:putative two-component system response regulator
MHGSAQQLLELINDLLDVSRYENREVPLHRERIFPAESIRDIVANWRFTAQRKRLNLQFIADEEMPAIWVDRKEMGKVVRNLVSNAVKFTPEGGAVTVRLRRDGEQLELSVSDTGPGIPDEVRAKLFTPFFQVDGSHTRAYEGTGLGLALVKTIAERHGGTVKVAPFRAGEGTTIHVRLPIVESEGASEPAALAPTKTGTDSVEPWEQLLGHMSDEEIDLIPSRVAIEETLPGFDSRPTVLIAEDNAILNAQLVRLLSSAYEVIPTADGMEALEKIRSEKPDLVLSDIMMPRMTGLQLLEAVRKEPAFERLPFVLLTAKAEGPDRVQGLWSGANDYLTKPFNHQELLARVANLLRIRGFEQYMARRNDELLGRSETLEGRFDQLFVNTVKTLVAAIDAKDYYTGGHSERVAFFSKVLAEPYNLSETEQLKLELGALLHDVGKIGVPDRVLCKPGELTPDEVLVIREHPVYSGKILDKCPELIELRHGAVYHHERWDGKGYPHGLKGEEIPWMARIISMADCWDAMVSDRVYRPGMDPEVAVAKIRKMAGTQMDPQVVEALIQVYPRMSQLPSHLRPLKARKAPSENHEPRVGHVDN